jgi:hypothetical protein
LAGTIVLIKAVLSSLPIYQFSTLLALKSIFIQFSNKIRQFLWQGGKTLGKKFHLLRRHQVKHPLCRGGLGIRDPKFMNMTMRDKLLWPLIFEKTSWWKQVLWKKYFTGPRQ